MHRSPHTPPSRLLLRVLFPLTLSALLGIPAPSHAAPEKTASAKTSSAKTSNTKTASAKTSSAKTSNTKTASAKSAKASGAKVADAKAASARAAGARTADTKLKGCFSLGAPNRGTLSGGTRLRSTRHLEVRPGARAWGVPQLVHALQRAATQVNKKHGRSVLLVGDLSSQGGGELDGHRSHQTGRDADIGFYGMNSKGKPVQLKRFVAFDSAGAARGTPSWVRFDDARNWTLVASLLEDRSASVRYLIVSSALRARLLAYAARKKVPQDLLDRAAAAMISPRDGSHDNHFHLRIACPEAMRGACTEESFQRSSPRGDGAAPAAAPADIYE
ncbi:penicillin-insensitive murein endopeptidase [Chondromyces apiculatus]|nr:penicillin-insensitive murein endopeptidase [Chondromyces apiculatus]